MGEGGRERGGEREREREGERGRGREREVQHELVPCNCLCHGRLKDVFPTPVAGTLLQDSLFNEVEN